MKKKLDLTIGKKIGGAFGIIVVVLTCLVLFVINTLNKGKEINTQITEVVTPALNLMKEIQAAQYNTQQQLRSWSSHSEFDEPDKVKLRAFHNEKYDELVSRLKAQKTSWKKEDQQLADTIISKFDYLITLQKTVTLALSKSEDYQDIFAVMAVGEKLDPEKGAIPRAGLEVEKSIEELLLKINTDSQTSLQGITESFSGLNILLWVVLAGMIGLCAVIAIFTTRSIVTPMTKLQEIIERMSKGVLPEERIESSNDEVGKMTKALYTLVDGLTNTSNFSKEIGEGKFHTEFDILSDEDVLGSSLLSMRDNLIKVAEDEKKRAWSTEGMAKFGDILRVSNDDLETLADNIISNLVKYLGSNQGGLFVVNDTDKEDKYLELVACYAWNKKKFLHMRIDNGEGIVGQAWQENDTIYLTEVPEGFVNITSGLGDANPTCFLIVPLTINDETFGVLEIASFHLIEDYQREFVKVLAESIASTLSTAKTNERTKYLLEQSQQQAEEMRAQEEEMRQNMEEMHATQEEMQRKETEMLDIMEKLKKTEEKKD